MINGDDVAGEVLGDVGGKVGPVIEDGDEAGGIFGEVEGCEGEAYGACAYDGNGCGYCCHADTKAASRTSEALAVARGRPFD